jgi:hypothetical protein
LWSEDALALLGELQFAFLAFLMGESYEGFEQWKVNTLCHEERERENE